MTQKNTGQQFFAAPPKRLGGDGPRRFANRSERQAAWEQLPRDWRTPFAHDAHAGGARTPGAPATP